MSKIYSSRLNCNPQMKLASDGGCLTNDAGMVLFMEFVTQLNLDGIIARTMHFTDQRSHFVAPYSDMFLQKILQNVAGYFHDIVANSWRNDPAIQATFGNHHLVTQPSLSRFFGVVSKDNLDECRELLWSIARMAFVYHHQSDFILDIDSTHCDTYGQQEKASYNAHYMANGYHPQVVFDEQTGMLLDTLMRPGNAYTGKDADQFIQTTFDHIQALQLDTDVVIRADSGFAAPEFYEACMNRRFHFIVRLKSNSRLFELAEEALDECPPDIEKDVVAYRELDYKAQSWQRKYRVLVRSVHKAGELIAWEHTFIVTNILSTACEPLFKRYQERGNVENAIKELKIGFGFDKTDSTSFIRNTARALMSGIAYNLVQLFKQLMVSEQLRITIATLRFALFHIAGKITNHAHHLVIHLASNHVYKTWFWRILDRIHRLRL